MTSLKIKHSMYLQCEEKLANRSPGLKGMRESTLISFVAQPIDVESTEFRT